MATDSFIKKVPGTDGRDRIESALRHIAEHIITFVFGFLPVIIIPVVFLPIDYSKVVSVIAAVAIALMFFSLSALRSGGLRFTLPPALIALWGVAGIAVLSAVFSGDASDAFLGDVIEVNTAVFLVLLAVVGSLTSFMRFSKMTIMRLYIFLTASAAILGVFHVLRLIFGPTFLSLGVFTNTVATTVGSWNDLGLFFGLSILLSIVALEQLPLTKWGRAVFTVGIALSLVMLGVINFSAVWWVLALVSLVTLMYALIRDRFQEPTLSMEGGQGISLQSILISLAVFVVSLMFIVAGGPLGGKLAELTGVSHLEVRPSFGATTEIARSVYSQNAFFGVGPNRFVDAWRQYKNPAINQTIFWNTDFRGGNGYITTAMVTMGVLGTIAWLVFLGLFLFTGFKMLIKTVHADRFWYFIASSSFVAATYLWVMSLIYLPGAAILLLASLFTAVTFAAYAEMVGTITLTLSVRHNKRTAIILVGVVMLIVVGCASTLYYLGRHYTAVYTYGTALTNVTPGVTTLQDVEQRVAQAFGIFQNDTYARQVANYQLSKIDVLLSLSEPTPEQQQEFQNAVVNGINSAQRATELDPTDALNWATLGSVYSVLVAAGEAEVLERAEEAFTKARELTPSNPQFVLLQAQLHARAQNFDRARELVSEAIALKSNYTEALNFLTELEISQGRTDEAIAAARSTIAIEPSNPARHYQLAILLSTKNDLDGAIAAFERAVALNTNYANARYLLALAYAQSGRTEDALAQLAVVLELNPDNQAVVNLIEQLESGSFTAEPTAQSSVNEPQTVSESGEEVTATEVPETPLISPVNTVPESPAASGESTADTTVSASETE